MSSSVARTEVEKFAKDSARWWDESGPFAPLHRLNPARMAYIKAQICGHFSRDTQSFRPFEGLNILDIGCGGGLVCEPLTRLGADVTGIDADAQAIGVAQGHAEQSGLKINYRTENAENITQKFDAVLALEVIEHVSDPEAFIKSCARLVKPGGMMIVSTLNRTPKSFALGIVAAEYLLRWVPRGTHSWKKFLRPSELARYARDAGFTPTDITGLVYNPVTSDFSLSRSDSDVNYFMSFKISL